jgi:hypothetical protein
MYNHQEKYHEIQLGVLRALYNELEAKYTDALFAQSEGVFEITIRSQSKTISIPIDGMDACQLVIEEISSRLSKTERDLRWHTAEQGVEYADELQQTRLKKEQADKDREQRWTEYEDQQRQLARQAAATATPAQKPGRPRKAATPKREVMETVGAMAAQVPMNGSTANAAARATGLTPQG